MLRQYPMFSPVPQNLQRIETQSVCSFLATAFKLEVAFLQSCPWWQHRMDGSETILTPPSKKYKYAVRISSQWISHWINIIHYGDSKFRPICCRNSNNRMKWCRINIIHCWEQLNLIQIESLLIPGCHVMYFSCWGFSGWVPHPQPKSNLKNRSTVQREAHTQLLSAVSLRIHWSD